MKKTIKIISVFMDIEYEGLQVDMDFKVADVGNCCFYQVDIKFDG